MTSNTRFSTEHDVTGPGATLHVLITGFAPFGGDRENASERAVSALAQTWDSPHRLSTLILPVTFAGAPAQLRHAVSELQPDIVISVGEAGRRAAITPERYARNIMDARIPDNAGAQPRDERIDAGPMMRSMTIDVDALTAAVRAAGLPAETSEDAGGFVCNRIAHEVATLDIPGAFVHVPGLRAEGSVGFGAETDAEASDAVHTGDTTSPRRLTIDDLATALRACINDAICQVSTR